jgi:PAS domain S-box-containing protein
METARLLVVEDENIIAMDLKSRLTRLGYVVPALVSSGEEAIQTVEQIRPDLVLMDIVLKGAMDGVQTAEYIRARFDVPVIYLTADLDEEVMQRITLSEPYGYILKPFEDRELQMAIQIAIYKHRVERKLKETFEKVERAKREWESTVDSLPQLVCLVDDRGYVMRANRTVEAWHLGRVVDVKDRGLHELLHPGCSETTCSLDAFLKQALAMTAHGQPADWEADDRLLKRYVHISAHPALTQTDAAVNTAVVIVDDITERKRVEEAEREQRALAEALRDTTAALSNTLHFDEILDRILANIGRVVPHDCANIMLIDAPGDTAYTCRSLGYAKFGVEDSLRVVRLSIADTPSLRTMAETGQPVIIPDVRASSDWVDTPETRWIRSYAGVSIRAKGHVIGFLNLHSTTPAFFTATHSDRLQAFADQAAVAFENARLYNAVSLQAEELERRVAERTAELERERQYLQTILDSAGEGIILTDRDERIVYVNAAMERLAGYTFAEAVEQTPSLWTSDRTPAAVHEDRKRTLANGEAWRGEVISRRKDGTLYDAALTITPLTGASGETIGYVGVQRDISQLKELDRIKDQFVSRIGHELRTPVTNVGLYLDLLERGKTDKREQYLQILHGEAARLRKLIEGVLEIAELNTSGAPIHLVTTDLNHLTADVIADHGALAAERSLSFDYQPEPGLPAARVDPVMISRVVSNLITNALDYTPRGGLITLTTASRHDAARVWVTLAVQDTGPGISPQEMPRLFERFYRGEAARDFATPGAGLGLAICKEVVGRLGGHITVESQAGHGATFTVWLKPAD